MQRYSRKEGLSSLLQTIYVKRQIAFRQKVLAKTKLYTIQSNTANFNSFLS